MLRSTPTCHNSRNLFTSRWMDLAQDITPTRRSIRRWTTCSAWTRASSTTAATSCWSSTDRSSSLVDGAIGRRYSAVISFTAAVKAASTLRHRRRATRGLLNPLAHVDAPRRTAVPRHRLCARCSCGLCDARRYDTAVDSDDEGNRIAATATATAGIRSRRITPITQIRNSAFAYLCNS